MLVREKKQEDDIWIVGMGKRFFEESNFKSLTFDPLALMSHLNKGHWIVIEDEVPIGFLAFNLARQYTREKIGLLFLYYVIPEKRGTKAGRMLLEKAVEVAKENGGARFYIASTAGISSKMDKSIENMFKKQGFESLGVFAFKDL